MREKIEGMISYIFGKYDMRKGIDKQLRMELLLDYCMADLESHPFLEESLQSKEALEFFVTQSIIYMIPIVRDNKVDEN